jgi:thioredoxin-dependent peroxiredoxin
MADLDVGDIAPDFELPRAGRGAVKLSALSSTKVVLYFYPADDTTSCTAEAIDFSHLKSDFAKAGAVVIGVSPDSRKSHDKFKAKHRLKLELAADEEKQAIQAYGVWAQKTLFAHTYMGVVRTTFLIGADGRIAKIWRKVRVPGHAKAVLAAVQAL